MGKRDKPCSLVPVLVGCHPAKALARALAKTDGYLLAPARLTRSFAFQQVPQAPLMSSRSVTGLGRNDRGSPQPWVFTPCLFPHGWAPNLTRVTFRVQDTLLQVLVPTESGP